MPEVPQSPSVKRDLLLRQMSPRPQPPAAAHPACSGWVPAPSARTTYSAAPLGPRSYELSWMLAHGLPDFGSKLQRLRSGRPPSPATLQPGNEEPGTPDLPAALGRCSRRRRSFGAAQRLKYVHVLLGPHQHLPTGRRSRGVGEARGPVCLPATAPLAALKPPRGSERVTRCG